MADTLGALKAISIVTGCANGEQDLNKKLSDIPALIPLIFESCVRAAITAAGFEPDGIPVSPDNTLLDVVNTIQGFSKLAGDPDVNDP